jgi:lysophospholipase L1-like esterase
MMHPRRWLPFALVAAAAALYAAALPGNVATTPVTQNRDHRIYDWQTRHERILERNKTIEPDVVAIGDSITHYWGGEPKAPLVWGKQSWDALYEGLTVTNLGFGWDRTENVIWRLQNGEFDGIAPKVAVVLIGTNNLAVEHTADQIRDGIRAIIDEIHERSPATQILLLGILPRERRFPTSPEQVNGKLAMLGERPYVRFVDASDAVSKTGKRDPKKYRDGVHLNAAGYAALAERIRPILLELADAK